MILALLASNEAIDGRDAIGSTNYGTSYGADAIPGIDGGKLPPIGMPSH